MGRALALIRAEWVSALSYRMGFVFALLGLVATFVPVYFVSGALQPFLADSMREIASFPVQIGATYTALSPSARHVAVLSPYGTVTTWDVKSRRVTATIVPSLTDRPWRIFMSQSGEKLYVEGGGRLSSFLLK